MASFSTVETASHSGVADTESQESARWLLVELRVESLEWLPGLLASLDLPFVIERPGELRDLVFALAGRLSASARRPETFYRGDRPAISRPDPPQDCPAPWDARDLLL